jgi:hypothetical protein
MKRKTYLLLSMALLFVMVLAAVHAVAAISKDEDKKVIMEKAFKIRVPFIANEGQIKDDSVRFYANTFGGTVYVTKSGQIVYSLPKFDQKTGEGVKSNQIEHKHVKGIALSEEFVDENVKAEVKGEEWTVTKVSYFKGNEPSKWKKDIPTYNLISLGEIYKGIELKLRAYGKNVEKLFFVSPSAKPEAIRVKVNGGKSLSINDKEELEVETEFGTVKFTKPVAYQEIDGKRVEVAVNYSILNSKPRTSNPELTYAFAVGNYEKTKELVIDPLLSSTFLGGNSSSEGAYCLGIDSGGNVYVAGSTYSADFPTTLGAYDTTFNNVEGYTDVFVSKLNSSLTSLLSSTFLGGGPGYNYAYSLAIDSGGNVYVAGETASSDFPTTPGAYDTTLNNVSGAGIYDAFVSKLDSSLTSLLSSTFLGGGYSEEAYSLAIDSGGNVYVAGGTASSDFPTTPGAYDTTLNGYSDAFVSKLNSNLTSLLSSTFLGGGPYWDRASSIAIDSGGNVYVAGNTDSFGFPTTPGAYDTTFNSGCGPYTIDAFVSKLNSSLTSLLSSTFLGGSCSDYPYFLAIDSGGNVYVAGYTYSADFPTTLGAYDTTFNNVEDYSDAFVSKLDSSLTSLLSSTFLGGGHYDYAYSLAIDSGGNVYVAGYTYSFDFPTTPGAYDTTLNGNTDAFVSKLDSSLTSLLSSTFLGGSRSDYPFSSAIDLAIDSGGNVYVTGSTDSFDFPTTPGAYDNTKNPWTDGYPEAFVSRFDGNLSASPLIIGHSPTSFSFIATRGGSNPPNQSLSIWNAGGGTLSWSVSDNANWLSLSPTIGTNWETVTVSVNIVGLTAGTYNATITITATGATNSPVSISVTLTVNPLPPPPPILALLSPNGVEVIPSGSTYAIRWNTPPEAVKFTLKYSLNNGSTWKLIASNRTGTSYDWHVPTLSNNKTKCLVKVIGFNSSGTKVGEDTSDSTFTIEVVKLTSPDGGEVLTSNSTHTITWRTNATKNPVAKVNLFYTVTGGSTWAKIKTLTGNPGIYNWTLPSVTVPKTQCKVKVVLRDSGGVTVGSDVSDGFFTIQP